MRIITIIIFITVITIIFSPAKARAATIASKSASLTTKATVEPILAFSIAGINNDTAINTGNSGCPNNERTNTGFDSSSTEVNLGRLRDVSTSPNLTAQLLQITTNAQSGYALTATSSRHLTNSSGTFSIADSPTPVAFPKQQFFGIHPCGIDVPQIWRGNTELTCSTTQTISSVCKYAWPAQNESLILASDSTGPSGNDVTPGNGVISVGYAASINATVPAGLYSAVIRYIVTPTF